MRVTQLENCTEAEERGRCCLRHLSGVLKCSSTPTSKFFDSLFFPTCIWLSLFFNDTQEGKREYKGSPHSQPLTGEIFTQQLKKKTELAQKSCCQRINPQTDCPHKFPRAHFWKVCAALLLGAALVARRGVSACRPRHPRYVLGPERPWSRTLARSNGASTSARPNDLRGLSQITTRTGA